MFRIFLMLLALIVYAWPDLVIWLGVWWAGVVAYTVLCFPLACMLGKFIGMSNDDRDEP